MSQRLIAVVLLGPDARPSAATLHLLRAASAASDQLVVLYGKGKRPPAPERQQIEGLTRSLWQLDDTDAFGAVFRILEQRLGKAALQEFDEVLVLDDSLFGPIRPPSGFPRVRGEDQDGSTLVEPERGDGIEATDVPYLALRGRVFVEARFWQVVAATGGEFAAFTTGLREAGFNLSAVHPRVADNEHYFLRDSIVRLLDEGLEFVPWRTFTIDPMLNDRWGIVPRESFDRIAARGFPTELIWSKLLTAVPPRTWYTNLSMAEVLPTNVAPESPVSLTTAVIAHIYYLDMADELLELAARIPGEVRLYATAADEPRRAALEAKIGDDPRFASVEVRAVTSNLGRDITAFLIDCEDVLRDPEIDVVVKLHSKRSVQDPPSVSGWFRRHLFESLFASEQYLRNVYELFETEPQLGMVFPPTIHMGLPTLGHAWSLNRAPAEALAPRLGLTTPFDANTPLSPYGSMFIARREALAPLLEANFGITEFPDARAYRDGSLAHVLERLISYVVFSSGYYAKTVTSPSVASVSEPILEYKLSSIGEYLPAYGFEQVQTLRGRGQTWPIRQVLRRLVWARAEAKVPGVGRVLSRAFRGLRADKAKLRR
ncbi:rhamnan synthesis F family protein [Gulosibacter massiliensis]|uniref:rhamnan synthesis F family protein n=1 Tax=Gulosibacter massiliensis TaxID=2479839 RepID=UPI0013DE3088|nr:rhamnan synthesis F family protein [Gulosibacter massiliensis]